MTKLITACISALILPVVKQYVTHYFDSKKMDAYSFYLLIALYCMAIVLIYSYYILLIVEKISKFRFLTFLISDILFGMFILGICISFCTLINNFTIFKNIEGEVFEKKSKNHNFFKDLIMLDKVTEIYQLNKMKRSSYHQKYQCDKYYYQDKEANSYYEYVYLYKKNSFMRMKRICPKRTEHLTLIVLLLFLFNGLYIYIALDNIPYKYSNSDYTEYTLIICNALLCIVGCIIISKLQSNIIKENKKDKSSKMNDIKLSEEKYNFKNIT